MKRISVLAVCISLCASSAFALIAANSSGSGEAGSAVVQSITLANGTLLTVTPTR